jgi:TolA protein
MTLAEKQKDIKPLTPPPPTAAATEAQQKLAQLRQRQAEQETAQAKSAAEAQQKLAQLRQRQAEQERNEQVARQRVADLRTEQSDRQAAQQRVTALRERLGNGGAGEGSGGSGSGTTGTGSGSGSPGSGRGTGTSGAGGIGTGGIAGIRLRSYEALIQEKVRNAWMKPPQSKGLEATVYLAIDRVGHVEQLRFVRKSGNALFDESLQRAIKQAEPLPPVPEDYTGRLFERELVFRGLD